MDIPEVAYEDPPNRTYEGLEEEFMSRTPQSVLEDCLRALPWASRKSAATLSVAILNSDPDREFLKDGRKIALNIIIMDRVSTSSIMVNPWRIRYLFIKIANSSDR